MYRFYIDVQGRVVLTHPDKRTVYTRLNEFVKNTFPKYVWLPAHKLSCKKCLVKTRGVLTFDFDPDKHHILCYINIVNEKSYKAFYHLIHMKIGY